MEESKKDKAMGKLKELATILFGKEETVETVESKFMDNKLADGTIIRYDADAIETGVVVSVVGEDGSVLPLPAGSYVLEDETTFDVVDENGTADNVVIKEEEVMEETAGAPATPVAEEAPKRDAKSIVESIVKETRFEENKEVEVKAEEVVEVEEPVVSTEDSFAATKAEFKKDIEAVEAKIEKQNDLLKEMFTIIEGYGKESEVKPTETKKAVFKRNVISKERAAELRKNFKAQLKG